MVLATHVIALARVYRIGAQVAHPPAQPSRDVAASTPDVIVWRPRAIPVAVSHAGAAMRSHTIKPAKLPLGRARNKLIPPKSSPRQDRLDALYA